MPINKETSSRLVKRNVTHDAISREVVSAITDPAALAIYTYLLTKPNSWVARRTDIIKHFNPMGRDTYDRGMRQLRDLGLVWTAKAQGENGQFIGNEIIVEQTFDRDVGKPATRENPTLGKSDHIEIELLPREEDIGVRGWDEWVAYRKEIKKKMTKATVKKQVELLKQYSPAEQQQIINESIQNGWVGLFKPKGRTNGQAGQPNHAGRKLSGAERTRLAREQARIRQTGG